LNPLHPRVTTAWRLSGVLAAAMITTLAAVFDLTVLAARDPGIFAAGIFTLVIAALAFSLALIWPSLRYRHWRWQVEPDRLIIHKGVIWRSHSLIPRVRVQHVDTRTSPLQRWLGLSSLIIYTAGTRGADAEIPGLTATQAEQLRDELAHLVELDEPD
jgi:membrane protein YdbS with pleckstrin-like domain